MSKIVALRAIKSLPEEVQQIIMSHAFPPQTLNASSIKEHLFKTAPKHRKRPSSTLKAVQSHLFIPFLLNQSENTLDLADVCLYPAERLWMHDWCNVLKLEHLSHDVPDKMHRHCHRALVIKKPPGWRLRAVGS